MSLKIASLPSNVLQYKIASNVDFISLSSDITQGSGTLHFLKLNSHTDVNHNYYVKISFTASSVSVGTTTPDVIIPLLEDTQITIPMPGGIAYSALSLWIVDSAGDSSDAYTSTNASNAAKPDFYVITS
tara:strand:- start:188 stop:574 length:387 start_codon:yes stop_codon:yes gene_type:complete